MVVVGLISSAFLLVAAPLFSVGGVWTGLFLFMTLRVVAGFWRKERDKKNAAKWAMAKAFRMVHCTAFKDLYIKLLIEANWIQNQYKI
ncbi:hypothetical protein Gorai_023742 [Gossypium raimondii]|uniref:Uncharacterized protein n=1 Tax=Gossypium raimondii TaxID=29730 RepID=A0A7J8NXE0_GOSRA|nr:hypothetical protein [Gossypium raimondii]